MDQISFDKLIKCTHIIANNQNSMQLKNMITNETLVGFGRVIEQWIHNSKVYENARQDLMDCEDFEKEACFESICSIYKKEEQISMEGVNYFCKSMGKPLGEREVIALFQYAGSNGKELNKFQFFYLLTESYPKQKVDSPSCSKWLNQGKTNNIDNKSNSSNNLSFLNSTRMKSLEEEEHLIGILKDMISFDREVNCLRQQLIEQNDFNIQKAYNLFSQQLPGKITKWELEQGLQQLGVEITNEQVFLLFKSWDRDKDNFISFKEFARMIERDNFNINENKICKEFSLKTIGILRKLFLKLLETEISLEKFRQELQKRPLFNLYEAFKTLDLNLDGNISYQELKEILLNYGIKVSEKDVINLFERFDSNKDGSIDYEEFIKEMSPKSPKKLLFLQF